MLLEVPQHVKSLSTLSSTWYTQAKKHDARGNLSLQESQTGHFGNKMLLSCNLILKQIDIPKNTLFENGTNFSLNYYRYVFKL